jgi:hypothetical protein
MEIDMIQHAWLQWWDYEGSAMRPERDGLLRALEEIANQDYRGNGSNESLIAQRALAAMRKGVARE